MSTYSASVRVDDGMLHTSRPLTAPDKVASMVDSLTYDVTESGGEIVSVELVVETSGESGTPIGDGIAATSSQPLDPAAADPVNVDDVAAAAGPQQ